jgi:peptidoglycan hydrolase-like protein with peptidoglycan-binding domain
MKSKRYRNIVSKNSGSTPFFQSIGNNHLRNKNNPSFFNQSTSSANGYDPEHIQRQPVQPVAAPLLTEDQISLAIRYNRFMYPPAQMRLLQEGLHVTITGSSNRETALAVAQYQDTNSLTVDGMAGPNTFATIHADTSITNKDDLILFSINVDQGISMTVGGGTRDMLGHSTVEIHLPPGNCDDYEYRQYICGEVEFQPAGAAAGTPFTSLNGVFTTQPGGSLPHIPNFHEDGNTALGSRYGHRNLPSRTENRYVDATGADDQAHGCKYLGDDRPGIRGRITNPGEVYDFDLRFLGEVRHKTRGRVAERWWNIQDTFVI